jgi:hypothetical protein
MKRILIAIVATGLSMAACAQNDSTATEKVDTIKIGGMIIIKKHDHNGDSSHNDNEVTIEHHGRRNHRPSNLTTNWGILDLGFANYNDNTDYSSAAVQAIVPGASDKSALELRTGKSVNVNLWFFMQRLNLIKHVANLKYGIGLELNNYMYDQNLHFQEDPTKITPAIADLKKCKLAADYVTIPLMLNFNFTPDRDQGFGVSAGVSAGYLYSSRFKTKDNEGGITKVHDSFGLEKFKLSYIGEVNLSFVTLYASYAFRDMWDNALDQQPFNFGLRFSHW